MSELEQDEHQCTAAFHLDLENLRQEDNNAYAKKNQRWENASNSECERKLVTKMSDVEPGKTFLFSSKYPVHYCKCAEKTKCEYLLCIECHGKKVMYINGASRTTRSRTRN